MNGTEQVSAGASGAHDLLASFRESEGAGATRLEEPGVSNVDHWATSNETVDSPQDVVEETFRAPKEGAEPGKPEPDAENEADEAGFIEIAATEEGGEARRIKIDEAVAAYDELQGLEGKLADVLNAAETQTQERARQIWQAQDKALGDMINTMNLWGDALQQMAPQQPDPDMLAEGHPSFNPQAFYRQRAAYDKIVGVFSQLNSQRQAAETERTRLATEQRQQFAASEIERLFRRDPEWRSNFDAKAKETQALMRDRYGIDEQTLAGLLHHGFYLAADDLVKYHKLLAGSKETKAKVEKTAPRIVRGNREGTARASAAAQQRGRDGKFVADAAKALDDGPYTAEKGRAFIKSLIKAGTI